MTSTVTGVRPTVVVGMSGGVDSAVAAKLLLERGYGVKGVFMKNWEEDDGTEYCTAEADFADAERVAEALDIELLTANFAAEYWDNVFEQFLSEYRHGRTPNPDVLCNREIKFNLFVDFARMVGADYIATGHYADRSPVNEAFALLKARDANKDQTYFLQAVPAAQLATCLFPLAELTKPEVRAIAKDRGFAVHSKKDSTGICFIGERRFADFLARFVSRNPGPIVDPSGRALGEHSGLAFYTIGQRQGLKIGGRADAREAPWYVMSKREPSNTLVVTQDERDLMSVSLTAADPNWLIDAPTEPFACTAKTRYRQPDQKAAVSIDGSTIRVDFELPQRAVTPGQYVALYDGRRCLGGARIETSPGPA